MASTGIRRARTGRAILLRDGALLAGGGLLGGAGLLLLFTAAHDWWWGGLTLLAGIGLAGLGARYLWWWGGRVDSALLPRRGILARLPAAACPADPAPLPTDPALARAGEDVRLLLMQLQMQADQLRDIALRIGHAADQHNTRATDQATAIHQVAAAMGELDHLMAQVTATAHGVALAADQVWAASTSSRRVVDTAAEALATAQQRVAETVQAIEALRQRATEIGAVSTLIAEIADHTHILALNASIEAAGAGEAGRRFEAVAAEIRTLAVRARGEGQQVGRLVQALEQAMGTTVNAANAGLRQTARTAQLTGTLTANSVELAQTAEQMQQIAATIDQAMAHQRVSAGEVTQALTHIADSARDMEAQTTTIAAEADDLIAVAHQLRGSALRFGVQAPAGQGLRLLIAGRETVSSRGLAWQALVDAWNQDHSAAAIAIEFTPPSDDYVPDLERALAAGTAADIVQVVNGAHLGRDGYLAPLDDLLAPAVRADFYPALLDVGCYQGRVYSLPTEAQPLIILYNRRLFDELDLAVPTTWPDFLAVARRCQTATRWGVIMDTTPGEYRAKQWLPFIWQGDGALRDETAPADLAAPAAQAAFALWRDLLITYRLAPLKLPHPFYDITNLVEGHCAMQYMGSWGLTMLREHYPDFPYGIMSLPTPPGGRPATALLRWGLAVNARSSRLAAARAFVQWALAGEGPEGAARVRSLLVEGLPVRRSVAALVAQEGQDAAAWHYLVEQIYPHARSAPDWSPATIAALDSALDSVLRELRG